MGHCGIGKAVRERSREGVEREESLTDEGAERERVREGEMRESA